MTNPNVMGAPQALLDPFQAAGDAATVAERVTLQPADSGGVLPRPKEVAHLWVEVEYDDLTSEQVALWESTAASETRRPSVAQAGLELQATELTHAVTGSRELLDQSRTRLQQTLTVLSLFRRRAVGSKPWYQLAKVLIFVGDMAGFAAAAMWLGEPPFIAVTLAASAAVATVVAGLVGTEYSDMRRRKLRERDLEALTPEERPFAHLFTDTDSGAQIVKRVLLLSLVTALTVGVGIGALRGAVDDPLVGFIFAGVAFAVAGGSFLVSYAGADEVADLIDLHQADYDAQQQRHLKLAADTNWQAWAEHGAEEASLREEFTARGDAATRQVQALKWRILRSNPSVAGHGPRPDDAVGRAPRKGGK